MSTGYWTRGNWVEGRDDREGKAMPCARCGHLPNKKGHDWCIRNLPGVRFACCGHGEQDGYIMFENGITIRGSFKTERGIDAREP